MEGFSFTLQPVLDHRRRLEDQAKQSYAQARTEEARARDELADMEDAFGDGQGEIAKARVAAIDPAEVSAYQRYLDRLKQQIYTQSDLVDQLNIASEEKREGVVEGMKARKVVEKLREKQHDQYKIEFARYEQKQTDEFAVTRHKRTGQYQSIE